MPTPNSQRSGGTRQPTTDHPNSFKQLSPARGPLHAVSRVVQQQNNTTNAGTRRKAPESTKTCQKRHT
eukprot:13429989-Alexandrium_andersonii.AAC.1